MADISMCHPETACLCAHQYTCYRNLAVPNPYRQSYSLYTPAMYPSDECPGYWPISEMTQEEIDENNQDY